MWICLQNNIFTVTSHIHEKLVARGEQDVDRKVLTFIPAKDGKLSFDGDSYWRVCLFIPRVARVLKRLLPNYLMKQERLSRRFPDHAV